MSVNPFYLYSYHFLNVFINSFFHYFSGQKREGFCQLLQQLKNKHSAKPDPDMITVFVGTWNMGKNSLA